MNEVHNNSDGKIPPRPARLAAQLGKNAFFCGLCLISAMMVVGFLTRFDRGPRTLRHRLAPEVISRSTVDTSLEGSQRGNQVAVRDHDHSQVDSNDQSIDHALSPLQQPATNTQATISAVDQAFAEAWRKNDLQVANEIDHLAYMRRMSLGLAGTVPSLEEIRAIEGVRPEYRHSEWIEHLLRDERTSEFLAERLTRAFVGVEEGPFLVFRRNRFVMWLAQRIRENVPYDQLVKQILADEGIWTQSPAVNFYSRTVAQDDDKGKVSPVLLAGRTSRAFLGMRIDCLQCHDDFLGNVNLGEPDDLTGGLQTDFHSLAAFFSSTQVSLGGIVDAKQNVSYEVQLLGDTEPSKVQPSVPFLSALDGKEPVARQRLANWVTHPENRPFARSIINRLWAIVYGSPLIAPVDDIPLAGPFPQSMEILVDDFVENHSDLHRLIKIIAGVKPARLDSKADFIIEPKNQKQFSVFPMRRLRPDQVAGAVIQSSSLTTIDSSAHVLDRIMKFGSMNDFVVRFGDPGEDEFKEKGETVTQKLLMMNGEMISDRINEGLHSIVHLAALSPNDERLLETVYLTALTRQPTRTEKAHFLPTLKRVTGDEKKERVQDIYWALVNSVEFAWNH